MLIRAGFDIEIDCKADLPLLLVLSTHSSFGGRIIGEDRVRAVPGARSSTFLDVQGNRITRLVAPQGRSRLWSDFVVEMDRSPDPQEPGAPQHKVEDLPDEALTYLLPSRYCDSDALTEEAWALFGPSEPGWPRVQAVCDFVHEHVTFGYEFGRADKTASAVFRERTGVCRDFAHLAIAFCRALNIPARYASGYLGDIDYPYSGPGDFCAWFEVYLGGAWRTFDARYNTPRIGRILMARGHDAGRTAMMTSFGAHRLARFRVWCDELVAGVSEQDVPALLALRPEPATSPPPRREDAA